MAERELPTPPAVGTYWQFAHWNNPDYTGPWEVVAHMHVDESEVPPEFRILLRRYQSVTLTGERKLTEADLRFWPGGWVPWIGRLPGSTRTYKKRRRLRLWPPEWL